MGPQVCLHPTPVASDLFEAHSNSRGFTRLLINCIVWESDPQFEARLLLVHHTRQHVALAG